MLKLLFSVVLDVFESCSWENETTDYDNGPLNVSDQFLDRNHNYFKEVSSCLKVS